MKIVKYFLKFAITILIGYLVRKKGKELYALKFAIIILIGLLVGYLAYNHGPNLFNKIVTYLIL